MRKINGSHVIGLLIVLFGIVALLNNFGIAEISLGYLFNLFWPLLLAIVGVNVLVNHRDLPGIITGAVILAMGVIFLGKNGGFFDVDMTYIWKGLWPVIIIIIGLNFLIKPGNRNTGGNLAIMGSIDKTKETWDLKSTEYTAIMGSIELDLRKAVFSQREVFLNLSVIIGGIDIIVPENTAVSCQGTSILGGVDMMGKGSGGLAGSIDVNFGDPRTASQVLNLNCTCIMGGIDIRY